MNAIILYDSKTSNGSTEAIIDAIGLSLAKSGFYVEKAKCRASADYSFVKDFDLVILGAPVYYFIVASQLLGSLIHGDLKKNLKRKKIALFLSCGSSEPLAALLYMPQLKIHLVRNKILAEKIFAANALTDGSVDSFAQEVFHQYNKVLKSRILSVQWTDEAQACLESVPFFLQSKFRTIVEEYAQDRGCKEITLEILENARNEFEGR